ncbi:hypothetical protein [Halobacterium yunchengense]|uniref:hypothetical protein n=1 Tax=Halobacterium yunchengense TaxID=3108497 RepID=UPI00300AFACB
MATRTERRVSWGIGGLGALVAVAAAYALFGVPVSSPLAAAVRSLAAVAGATVAAGAWLVATERVPVQPTLQVAAGPGALAGAALAMSGDGLPTWVQAGVGVGVAAGVLGFAVVLASVGSDNA